MNYCLISGDGKKNSNVAPEKIRRIFVIIINFFYSCRVAGKIFNYFGRRFFGQSSEKRCWISLLGRMILYVVSGLVVACFCGRRIFLCFVKINVSLLNPVSR